MTTVASLVVPYNSLQSSTPTTAYFSGGEDIPINAGDGTTQVALTGLTERLPLGVLLQDSDFLGENPLGDNASAFRTIPAGLRPVHDTIPLTMGGEEFTRFLGEPGSLIVMADGKIAPYSWAAYTGPTAPIGATRRFRLYRGGGSAFMLSGANPGGPVDWMADIISPSLNPVLKGGVLVGKALLVRNYHEEAQPGPWKTTDGDEVQLVILTYGHLGDTTVSTDGITMDGVISPSGYGEGYAAADRYRVPGRPLVKAYSRETPDPATVQIAAYPETTR